MMKDTITFIGGGNMATSLIGGLIADGAPPSGIWACDPDPAKLETLASRYGVRTSAENTGPVGAADVLVLAVKPQVMREVTLALGAAVAAREPLVVSVAAGVREPDIRRWLGCEAAIVRCMPNTPALVQAGATALFANPRVSAAQRERAEAILGAVGMTVWLDHEDLMDSVTALSGSGPAYAFLLMELMIASGVELGLTPQVARSLALQTVLGAAQMALSAQEDPQTLRVRVTSPGGTTERAIGILESGGVRALVARAIRGARDRSVELGRMLGDGGG